MHFVSIGPYCCTARLLKKHNLRTQSFPFDWIYSSLDLIDHALNDEFKIYLDKTYYRKGTSKSSTKHTFYCKYLDTQLLKKHHVRHKFPKSYIVSSGNLFNHQNLFNEEEYEQIERRCNRLMNLINDGSKVVLVYYNVYTNDFRNLMEFQKQFKDKPNVFVLGIYENRGKKKVLCNQPKLKIYQNHPIKWIFNHVQRLWN